MTFSRNILITLAVASRVMLRHTYSDNDRSGVNCSVVADTDASKKEAVCADPHIPANVYFRSRRGAMRTTAPVASGICRRLHSINGYVGTNGCVVPDGDVTGIQKLAVHPNGHIAADVNVVAVIAIEGSFDNDGLTQMPCRRVATKSLGPARQ